MDAFFKTASPAIDTLPSQGSFFEGFHMYINIIKYAGVFFTGCGTQNATEILKQAPAKFYGCCQK